MMMNNPDLTLLFSDIEIASRMVGYIERTETLMKMISEYLSIKNDRLSTSGLIHKEYKSLKEEIRSDAHFLSLKCNNIMNDTLLQTHFRWAIPEASAYGFDCSSNCAINQVMHSAVEDAHYRLTKYDSLDKWQSLSKQK